jgi:hypothetical protein
VTLVFLHQHKCASDHVSPSSDEILPVENHPLLPAGTWPPQINTHI